LGGLQQLTTLSLGNRITGDITVLGHLRRLTALTVGASITGDINVVKLMHLTALTLTSSTLASSMLDPKTCDLTQWKALTSITLRYFSEISVDISPLKNVPHLASLTMEVGTLDGDPITGLENVTQLTTLNIVRQSEDMIPSLRALTSLTSLTSHCMESNVDFLRGLNGLTSLTLKWNPRHKFSILGSLTNLTYVKLMSMSADYDIVSWTKIFNSDQQSNVVDIRVRTSIKSVQLYLTRTPLNPVRNSAGVRRLYTCADGGCD
jgi:Leucine-rich repeat (LRR) protein